MGPPVENEMKPSVAETALQPCVQEIWERYGPALAAAEAQLTQNLTSDVPLVGDVARYILGSGGKRFRPLILAASARMAGAPFDRAVPADPVAVLGCVVEYIHTATLLHDDVVDDGDVRRGRDAARTVWGNAGSVLVGDYLYARALSLSVTLDRLEIVRVLARVVEEMSEGEVFQLAVCGDVTLSEAVYLRIVERKTASLMSAACRLGGMLGRVSARQEGALADFGRNVGIAFQVADDTLDYAADAEVFGKALGKDLQDGKITLPLLYTLQRCTAEERDRLVRMVEGDAEPDDTDRDFVVDRMARYGAIADALSRARDFARKARAALTAAFPQGPDRQALLALADYVVERDH
jgi:octaprenyl-diphosphate synthase